MCELFAMSSRLPATVTLSLHELARHGGATGPHRDGWGIAYYAGGDALVVKEARAAADSACVRFIESHELASDLVISHVRKATRGDRALRNTQPLAREVGGRMHVFAHNGDLGGVERRPELALGVDRPIGDTDSEYAFCALLARVRPLWAGDEPPPVARRREVVAAFARAIAPLGPANFLYADGELLFAHGHRRTHDGGEIRPPGLWSLCRSSRGEPPAGSPVGVRIAARDEPQQVVLFASVPLTGEGWTPLAEGELVVASAGAVLPRE